MALSADEVYAAPRSACTVAELLGLHSHYPEEDFEENFKGIGKMNPQRILCLSVNIGCLLLLVSEKPASGIRMETHKRSGGALIEVLRNLYKIEKFV